eukprot:6213590-Pleurochrysis_carterae.AAC.1
MASPGSNDSKLVRPLVAFLPVLSFLHFFKCFARTCLVSCPYRPWYLLEMLMNEKLATLAGEESDKLILTTTDGSICGVGVQEDVSAERALCDVCEAGGVIYHCCPADCSTPLVIQTSMGLSLQMLSWGVQGEGVLDAFAAFAAADRYRGLVRRLGSAWRQQKWARLE